VTTFVLTKNLRQETTILSERDEQECNNSHWLSSLCFVYMHFNVSNLLNVQFNRERIGSRASQIFSIFNSRVIYCSDKCANKVRKKYNGYYVKRIIGNTSILTGSVHPGWVHFFEIYKIKCKYIDSCNCKSSESWWRWKLCNSYPHFLNLILAQRRHKNKKDFLVFLE